MRWNESHSASRLPPILLCCLSPAPLPSPPPSPAVFLTLSQPTDYLRVSLSLQLSLLSSRSLFSTIYGSTFLLLSILYQPSTLFLFVLPPAPSRLLTRNTYTREPWSALYTRAHVLTYIRLQGFCSWRPILSDNEDDPFSSRGGGRKGQGADGRGDTILPSCRGRDIFSLSRDNLETGVALPARESSEGARDSAPGKTLALFHPLSLLFPVRPLSRLLSLSLPFFAESRRILPTLT